MVLESPIISVNRTGVQLASPTVAGPAPPFFNTTRDDLVVFDNWWNRRVAKTSGDSSSVGKFYVMLTAIRKAARNENARYKRGSH
jgi:hypothetical protein